MPRTISRVAVRDCESPKIPSEKNEEPEPSYGRVCEKSLRGAIQLDLFAGNGEAETVGYLIAPSKTEQAGSDGAERDAATTSPLIETEPVEPRFIVLNDQWRVRLDEPLLFVLESRQGQRSDQITRYIGVAWCAKHVALMRNIRERCGEISADARAALNALPERRFNGYRPLFLEILASNKSLMPAR